MRRARSSLAVALSLEALIALAQGALAVVLGALARALSGVHDVASSAMAMTPMSRLWPELAPTHGATRGAVAVALVGLVLVLVRGGAAVALAGSEARVAAAVATDARLRLLRAALSGASSAATSMGAAVTWPAELEIAARAERSRARARLHLLVLALATVAIDAKLAAVVLLSLAPFALLLRPIRRALRSAHERAARAAVEMIDATRDVVEHAAVWAVCGGGATACLRVDALSREGARLAARAASGQAVSSASNEVLAAIAVVILVAAFAPSAALARPTLVPVLVALTSAYRPLRELAESSVAIERGARASQALDALAADERPLSPAEIAWPSGTLSLRAFAVDVGGARARRGIDAEVAPGLAVAIVGTPGTGKSALLEAIAGVRRAHGTLRFTGIDPSGPCFELEGAHVGPAARPIAWVPPSPPVLPGTLAENLAPDAPRDAARIARARAYLRELGDRELSSLDDDAMLGPRGLRPSSGEAQRLALARALASPAPVLLLDEPTANLDEEGERRAIEVLRRARATRAILLVTHRPAPRALATTTLDLDVEETSGQGSVGAAESERRIA